MVAFNLTRHITETFEFSNINYYFTSFTPTYSDFDTYNK